MGMQTAIQVGDKRFLFMTEQYEVGLYIAIYSAKEDWTTIGTPIQNTSTKKEIDFHKGLRKKAREKGNYIETHSSHF